MKTLYLLGDSVAAGIIYKGNFGLRSYGRCTEESALPFSACGFAPVNRAHMGTTAAGLCKKIVDLTTGINSPDDLLILSCGGNDCDFDWKAVSTAPAEDHLPKTDPDAFAASYRQLLLQAQSTGARVAVTNLVPLDAERYFAHISRGLDAGAILRWLGDTSMLYRFHESYSAAVERIAAACGSPVIDVRGAFLQAHNFRELLCEDGIHPTEAGHRLYRETVAQAAAGLFA